MSRPFLAGLVMTALTASSAYGVRPSTGCGTAGLTSGTYTIEYGGQTRTFRLFVPTGYDKNRPARLVAVFHGWGGDENQFLGNRTVTSQANARGYILVAPRGLGSGAPDFTNNSWTFRGSATGLDGDGVNPAVPADTAAICDPALTPTYTYSSCSSVAANTCSWTHCQADDIGFTLALTDYVKSRLCVDVDNVFATGGSNGGMFTWELGQNPVSAPVFRAIAPLIGLPHRAHLSGKGKPGDLPALVITGTNDPTVPPGAWENPSFTTTSDTDRYYYTGATAITRAWAASHGCSTAANAVPFDDGYRQTDCRTYCTGDGGWPRVLDCRARMGHVYSLTWSWPLILDFFDGHSLP